MTSTTPLRYSIVLYDHACPMCRTEILRLKALDRHGRLRAVNIAHPQFDAAAWGFTPAQLSGALHVRAPDGAWLVGMPAIRHVYAQVGLGWLLAPTGWPWTSKLFDRLYAAIARNRLAVSRWLDRTPYRAACDDGRCGFDPEKHPPRDLSKDIPGTDRA